MNSTIDKEELESIDYLSFHSFELNLLDNNIVWAPNGVGKSSIYRQLQKTRKGNISFVDCEAYKTDIIKKKKAINIGANISSLAQAQSELDEIKSKFDIEGSLKKYELTNATTINNAIPDLKDCKKEPIRTITSFSPERVRELLTLVDGEDIEFLLRNVKVIRDASSILSEVEEIKNAAIKDAMAQLDAVLSSEDDECPICGSAVTGIKQVIADRRKALKDKKEPLISTYRSSHKDISIEQAAKKVDDLILLCGNKEKVTDAHILDAILSNGLEERAAKLAEISKETSAIETRVKALEKERDSFFKALTERETEIRDFFCLRYEVEPKNIKFNPKDGAVNISLPRNVDTYSTGEIDFMVLMIGINAYIANDTEALIIDDPISSFDIANQYTVMFELVKLAKDEKRPVTILTHNMNCINIADSQMPKAFQYWYLEKESTGLTLMNIEIPHQKEGRFLSPESLISAAESEQSQFIKENLKYLEALMNREGKDPVSVVFHYDGEKECPYKGSTLSNKHLADLIETNNQRPEDSSSFISRCTYKMLSFVALRVWVEKQLYEGASDDSKAKMDGHQLGEKIDILFPSKKPPLDWQGNPSINRQYLYSKKTMMNHQAHPGAQSMPFEFALNLCQSDIDQEVNEIKERFSI